VDPKAVANPALAAYTKALAPASGPATGPGSAVGPGAAAGPPASSFAELLAESVTDAVAAGRQGEAAATEAAVGKAGLQDVVEAVNAAELSLRTVVAVRDRVIAAYQEIMRMPI